MRVFVIHDQVGAIHGVVIPSVEESHVNQENDLGRHVLEAGEVAPDDIYKYITAIYRDYRILPVPLGPPSLIKKTARPGNSTADEEA
jgi:hypothetical protein